MLRITKTMTKAFTLVCLVLLYLISAYIQVKAQTNIPLGDLPIPVPGENPITEEKRVLGKILFWDEQLSSDNTVACGTCHLPAFGGTDNRKAIHPGADEKFNTEDDVIGSPGIARYNENLTPVNDPFFGHAS